MDRVDGSRRFYLLTLPRTASNLLTKMLGLDDQSSILSIKQDNQPSVLPGYFFMPTVPLKLRGPKLTGKHLDDWTDEERKQMMDAYQISADALRKHLEAAEAQGKNAFVKEHLAWLIEPVAENKFIHGEESTTESPWKVEGFAGTTYSPLNKTVFPDEFLRTWLPTFLIRHPALAFPSRWRAYVDTSGPYLVKKEALKLMASGMTYSWSRSLFDWYTQQFGQSESTFKGDVVWPIVLDSDDIMLKPDIVRKYSKIIGMDPKKLRFSWDPTSEAQLESLGKIERRMLSTISASDGIVAGKTSIGLDIDVEAAKWRVEFGDEVGDKLQEWVRDAMPNYEYLKERRLRA